MDCRSDSCLNEEARDGGALRALGFEADVAFLSCHRLVIDGQPRLSRIGMIRFDWVSDPRLSDNIVVLMNGSAKLSLSILYS